MLGVLLVHGALFIALFVLWSKRFGFDYEKEKAFVLFQWKDLLRLKEALADFRLLLTLVVVTPLLFLGLPIFVALRTEARDLDWTLVLPSLWCLCGGLSALMLFKGVSDE